MAADSDTSLWRPIEVLHWVQRCLELYLPGRSANIGSSRLTAGVTVQYCTLLKALPNVVLTQLPTTSRRSEQNDHPQPLRTTIIAAPQFPHRTTGSPRNWATTVLSDFGRFQFFCPCSDSPPLPH